MSCDLPPNPFQVRFANAGKRRNYLRGNGRDDRRARRMSGMEVGDTASLVANGPRHEPARSGDACRVFGPPRQLHRDRPRAAKPAGAAGPGREPRGAAARAQHAAGSRRFCARLSQHTARCGGDAPHPRRVAIHPRSPQTVRGRGARSLFELFDGQRRVGSHARRGRRCVARSPNMRITCGWCSIPLALGASSSTGRKCRDTCSTAPRRELAGDTGDATAGALLEELRGYMGTDGSRAPATVTAGDLLLPIHINVDGASCACSAPS